MLANIDSYNEKMFNIHANYLFIIFTHTNDFPGLQVAKILIGCGQTINKGNKGKRNNNQAINYN